MTQTQKPRSSNLLIAALALAPLAGCATAQPPQELLDARAAYNRAQNGYAHSLSPASLHSAKVALDDAERKFDDDGASAPARDQAYVALRKAQLADADGSTAHYQRELETEQQRSSSAQARSAAQSQSELEQARRELASEAEARRVAEQRAKDAIEHLTAMNAAAVKQEPRGMVITLSGQVLFASGKSALLPGAENKLSQVADALKDQNSTQILVEGHTDSTGSEQINMQLSEARADAVSSYLASRGVPEDQITTKGVGASHPVADNQTAEGRANNRRVEIVLRPSAQP